MIEIIVICAVVAAVLVYAGVSLYRLITGKSTGCSSCGGADSCASKDDCDPAETS